MHRMRLTKTHPDGSQEFACTVCPRRIHIHWPPNYSREVLEEGDEAEPHAGGTGGLVIGAVEVYESSLEPFLRYFDQRSLS